MIIANETVQNAIISPVRTITAGVEFYMDSTLVHSFKHNDNLISFDIERVGEESKFFGLGICQKANIKLIDKNRELSFTTSHSIKIYLAVGNEIIYPYPTFYITEVHRDENTNQLSITAYDLIYSANQYTVADLGISAPYTTLDFAQSCANKLGVTGLLREGIDEAEKCFDTVYPEGANFGGDEVLREALNDVAEATQTIYYIDRNDNLVFKRLDVDGAPVLTIRKADYITLDSGDNRRLGGVCSATELGDNVIATTEATGTTQYVRDNAFWELREDVAALVDAALAAVGGMRINQFNCAWRGNFLLELGDKFGLITKDNKTVCSYLLNDTVSYNGAFSQKTQWNYTDSEESAANPTSLGDALNKTFARVDKVNRQIELVVQETEGMTEAITSIGMTTEAINATVRQVETNLSNNVNNINNNIEELAEQVSATMTSDEVKLEIQRELLEGGAGSVTTATGFTFNNDGMTISKSGAEMTTQITEDGMTVYRNSTEVLVANNTGVDAANLRATTYLVIGSNSRFQDYNGNRRTGCFWLT